MVKMAEPILGWRRTETLLLALPLAVGYVYLSGYLGVVLSNIVQIAVMTLGSVVLAVKVLIAVGGPAELARKLAAIDPVMLANVPPWDNAVFPAIACIGWLLGTSIGYGGQATPTGRAGEGQRILSSRGPQEACNMYLGHEAPLVPFWWLLSAPF